MTPSTYKLTYFNTRGASEGIRFIFAYANVKFEDNRIKREDWPALKEKTTYGQLPILEVDGKVMNQSVAMCRFLGKRFGLVPDDPWTEALLDALVDNVQDSTKKLREVFANRTPETEKAAAEALKLLFDRLEKIVSNNSFYGKFSWVDLYFAGYIETLKGFRPEILKDHPILNKLVENVINNENIKKYIANRPVEDPLPGAK